MDKQTFDRCQRHYDAIVPPDYFDEPCQFCGDEGCEEECLKDEEDDA